MATVLDDAHMRDWLAAAAAERWIIEESEIGREASNANRIGDRHEILAGHRRGTRVRILRHARAPKAPRRALTPTDLNMLARISDPQVSPDGRYVVYVQRETDLEANRGRSDLWLLDLEGHAARPRRLTQHSANDTHPRWSVDGTSIYFLSTRTGSQQIWRLPLTGGEAVQITDYPLDVTTFRFSRGGGRVALSMEVFRRLPRSEMHARPARRQGEEQGVRPRLRQSVRAALGYLERRHAIEPVRGAGQSRRPCGHTGERQQGSRCRRSLQAQRRRRGIHFQSRRVQPGVQRAGRGTSGSLVDEFRYVRSVIERHRHAQEPDP